MKEQTIYRYCVYTIRDTNDLDAISEKGSGSFKENKKWVEGSRLFNDAERQEKKMPIVFSAAEKEEGLCYYAMLEKVEVDDSDANAPVTEYSFSGLTRLKGDLPKSTLIKKSNGEPLSNDYIRPYSICYTPDFIE